MKNEIIASRRSFIATSLGGLSCLPLLGRSQGADYPLKGRIKKTLKIGMIGEGSSLEEKFLAARSAGFEGVEINAPGTNVELAKKAVANTGFPIDGSVCAAHWQIRHTSPDASQRAQALENLKRALEDTKAVGGDTVLLVVGHGDDGPEAEIWKRSVENIQQAVLLAKELDMIIAIENVWNHFCYDHHGDSNQTADKFKKYCEEFASPHVKMQFDIGNHWKYGPVGEWIRTLGPNLVYKLDIKGFSRAKNTFTAIGEDDLDWTDVRKALIDIDYKGWCAAEVEAGKVDYLKGVAAAMDRVLKLT